MENITIKDILKVTGGILLCGEKEQVIKKLSTDSRKVDVETLFVPLIGERVDAHQYLLEVLKTGAAAFTMKDDRMNEKSACIRVADTLQAMQDLAAYYRSLMTLPIVAVTGSVGKTTTREMISAALSAKYQVFQTEGNYNSQVGVPLTISRLSAKDEIGVLEVGISEEGEMDQLTHMVKPDIAVFTNIGVAHIEQLKTRDNICIEKMKLIKGLSPDGLIFINGDDPILMAHKNELEHRTFTYGLGDHLDYRGVNIHSEDGSTYFDLLCEQGTYQVELNVLGDHNVQNALAAIGIANQCGIPIEDACEKFTSFQGLRQQVHKCNNYTIIDDTYNASPESMKASLSVLAQSGGTGRKIAVLADMLELGDQTEQYHYQVGEFIANQPIDIVLAVGELSKCMLQGVTDHTTAIKTYHFDSNESLLNAIKKQIQQGDTILLKGSNGMKLKEIATQMLQ